MARLIVFLFASIVIVRAQVVNATLTGIVTDPTGASVEGARLRAINTGTNQVHETASSSGGTYSIPALAPGEYRLEAEQAGFKKQVLSGIVLQVAQEARVNVTLEVGQVTESVNVASSVP